MAKTTLRILYINAENLFSPGVRFYNSSYSESEYLGKINWLGSTIAFADADVVALTEVGDDARSCIDDVVGVINNQNPSKAIQETFIARPSKGSTKIRAAVLSRFPITSTSSLIAFPSSFKLDLHDLGTDEGESANWVEIPVRDYSRPVAKVRIEPPNNAIPFNMFVVHLKSKRPTIARHDGRNHHNNEAIGSARSAIRRNIEAAALRVHLNKFLVDQFDEDPRVPSILIGDFNDTPTSVPLENIRGPFDRDPGPSSPWTMNDKVSLITCARLHLMKGAYEDRLYSYIHEESFSLIDQALISKHLVGRFQHLEVINDHVLRHQQLKTSVTTDDRQWKSIVSDHGAIVLQFTRMLR